MINRVFVSTAIASLLILCGTSVPSLAQIPLGELLSSRVGKFILAEVSQGSEITSRLLGDSAAQITQRTDRLVKALNTREMERTADILSDKMNRVYTAFADRYPQRATQLFRGAGRGVALTNSERAFIRQLADRELDRSFIDLIPNGGGYARTRSAFNGGTRPPAKISADSDALAYWETQKNAAAARSSDPVQIENYEVPMDLLEADLAKRLPAEIRNSLIFERNGRKWVRWIINPEDTIHYKDVEAFLVKNNVSIQRHQTFTAYQTASRSYIIVNSKNGTRFRIEPPVEFSAKVSTDKTGGLWKDKKQPVGDAMEARRAADFVYTRSRQVGFKHVVIMDEPAMFGIREIDQAMLIRSLGELPQGQVTYLPGFSAVHEQLGAKIARANGSMDPAAFWNEHYNKPLAKALGEFAAKTGLTYDSPHSQNFLIEMIGLKPTGRIVLRDFGDTYAFGDFFEAIGQRRFIDMWPADNVIRGHLQSTVGILHGNSAPSWLPNATYNKWGQEFFEVFEAEFSAITGIPRFELKATLRQSGKYFTKAYPVKGNGWQRYLQDLGVKPQHSGQ